MENENKLDEMAIIRSVGKNMYHTWRLIVQNRNDELLTATIFIQFFLEVTN